MTEHLEKRRKKVCETLRKNKRFNGVKYHINHSQEQKDDRLIAYAEELLFNSAERNGRLPYNPNIDDINLLLDCQSLMRKWSYQRSLNAKCRLHNV
jgi:hypothetical protein|tara:strand:- start:56 stop:343 length:288 start_codon:yes stop_codon:yes gene_type:complete